MKTITLVRQLVRVTAVAAVALLGNAAQAAAPGITGTTFNLDASAAYITQPDGATLYSWGYGCTVATTSGLLPAGIAGANCPTMQLPGPTLIVHEGDVVTVNLTNNLPAQAGRTSILFPGFAVTATGGVTGLPGQLTNEAAASGGTVSYQFTATKPGTHSYYSGSQADLQVEMGLYGAIIVLPTSVPTGCTALGAIPAHYIDTAAGNTQEVDFRLAASAYDHGASCYDREYLFQFSEMDPLIHRAAEEIATCVVAAGVTCPTNMDTVATEPYHPGYYMINGRSMPDDMDPNYSVQYPHQPYNGNPHMHPGELTLLRIVGQGRWQHPFHEHGNHVRLLARDGNLLLAPDLAPGPTTPLAGPLLFTTTTTPGQTLDGIFQWTGKGLNWDVFGHRRNGATDVDAVCSPDVNGYNSVVAAPNYYEWCGDHGKALENKPFGAVGGGGPATLPDPNIVANGPWYSGSPYLGGEATGRAVGATPIPPSGTVANDPVGEAGFAYMWHSHNEREITTNNIFPGGMLMMMLVDPRAYQIDESK
ncbi:MAG TPA: multicopper oxidase family protein [Steroidobacteraceae bacterium]|nr:multicopper oxidase family protein [Steroidobacteraceae bacterium]